jgi:hypothetical protein
MKSESRVKNYKPGSEDWKAEYNMKRIKEYTAQNALIPIEEQFAGENRPALFDEADNA